MEPLYLLDTNILVHYIRDSALWQIISHKYQLFLIEPTPLISVITRGEIRSLALQRNWGSKKLDRLEYLIGSFDYQSIDDEEIIRTYAALDSYCESIGQPMGKNDLWIGATAVTFKATLLTTDRDFDRLSLQSLSRDWIDPITP